MTILTLIGLSTVLILRGVTQTWSKGQLRTERYQQARLLFDLFERELSSSVASSRYPLLGLDASDPGRRAGSTADELFFVGTLPGRAGLVERGYWVNAAQQLQCHDEEPADGDYATGTSELCGREVFQFDVAYFDGGTWRERWDGRGGLLPKAIQVRLTVGQERPEQFETVVHVPTS